MSGPILNKIRVKELKFQFLKGVENLVNVTKTEYEERTIGVRVTVVTVIPVSTTGWSIESV